MEISYIVGWKAFVPSSSHWNKNKLLLFCTLKKCGLTDENTAGIFFAVGHLSILSSKGRNFMDPYGRRRSPLSLIIIGVLLVVFGWPVISSFLAGPAPRLRPQSTGTQAAIVQTTGIPITVLDAWQVPKAATFCKIESTDYGGANICEIGITINPPLVTQNNVVALNQQLKDVLPLISADASQSVVVNYYFLMGVLPMNKDGTANFTFERDPNDQTVLVIKFQRPINVMYAWADPPIYNARESGGLYDLYDYMHQHQVSQNLLNELSISIKSDTQAQALHCRPIDPTTGKEWVNPGTNESLPEYSRRVLKKKIEQLFTPVALAYGRSFKTDSGHPDPIQSIRVELPSADQCYLLPEAQLPAGIPNAVNPPR